MARKIEEEKRIKWLDSLKAFAVALVVIGHSVSLFGEDLLIERLIYLFHMPLFFIISGVIYESFSKKNSINELKNLLLNREINLLIPAFIFTGVNIIFGDNYNIFNYYNGVWFLIFLALIIVIAIIQDYWSLTGKNCKAYILFIAGLFWFVFAILQLFFIQTDRIVLSKFACEISKFGGYLICFYIGIVMIRNKDKFMKINSIFYISCITFVVLIVLSVLLELDNNIALTKIPCGISGGNTDYII